MDASGLPYHNNTSGQIQYITTMTRCTFIIVFIMVLSNYYVRALQVMLKVHVKVMLTVFKNTNLLLTAKRARKRKMIKIQLKEIKYK